MKYSEEDEKDLEHLEFDKPIFVNLIESCKEQAKETVLELIKKEYKITGDMALKLYKIVEGDVRAELISKNIVTLPHLEFERKTDMDRFIYSNYVDFFNWQNYTMNSIVYYQSVGDTIGYKNGDWEFNYNIPNPGPEYTFTLLNEFINLGGINDLDIKNWKSSDDTILYLASIKAMQHLNCYDVSETVDIEKLVEEAGVSFQKEFVEVIPLIKNRHPGSVTNDSLQIQKLVHWDKIPYNEDAIGAGAVMRAGSIGLYFFGIENRPLLIALSIVNSMITHNSIISMLGCITYALFTAYCIEKVDINLWIDEMLDLIHDSYTETLFDIVVPGIKEKFIRDRVLYAGKWKKYRDKFIVSGNFDSKYMKDISNRYKNLQENFSRGCGMSGSCADDCLIFAYDSLLRSGGVLEKLLVYSVLHPGDSDTVGSIAFSLFAGYYNNPIRNSQISRYVTKLEFYKPTQEINKKSQNIYATLYYYHMFVYMASQRLEKYVDLVR